MKSTPIFVAAAGFAMVGACSVSTKEDNGVDENGAAAATTESAAPAAGGQPSEGGEVDTLGNQLEQLNTDAETSTNTASDQQ